MTDMQNVMSDEAIMSETGRGAKLCEEHGKRIAVTNERIDLINRSIYGANGKLGMSTKIEILWRVQIWLVAFIGVAVGSSLTMLCQRVFAN